MKLQTASMCYHQQRRPAGLNDFVNFIVPELQRRGLFRTEYEGHTLRENLGLKRPVNQYLVTQPNTAIAS